jgi:hypothetical protein
MLTQAEVLTYIKDNLGWPFMHLELEDDKILDYVITNSLKEFTYYVPQVWKVAVNLNTPGVKLPGVANEFYIHDPQGLEILNVVDFYTTAGDLYLHGHPPLGALSMGEIKGWALQVETSMMTKMFSPFDYTCEFRHPNILRISPVPKGTLGTITVEYEREQPPDLSGIPNDLHEYYKRLALADIMIVIGRIRKRYGGGSLRTPFGEIPLESDIHDEGKEMKREVLEVLERLYIPNVRIDHG